MATLGQQDVYETATLSPDGSRVAVYRLSSGGGIAILETSTGIATPLASGFWGAWSPDGQWIAYTSTESGRGEIHVQSFPGGRGKWQVSLNGGDFPRWRRDGSELLYVAPDQMVMSASVQRVGDLVQFGEPKSLFKLSFPAAHPGSIQDNQYDVGSDGRILGFTTVRDSGAEGLVVLSNWDAELTTP